MRVAVIGVGQSLRGDDAAGLEAVRRWQAEFPATAGRAEVRVEISELPGLGLLEMLEGIQAAVVVDCVQSGAAPGTVHYLGMERLSAFEPSSKSAHGWGAAETLRFGFQVNPDFEQLRMRLIGIEARQCELGSGLSPEVKQGMRAACEAIQKEVETLLEA